MKNKGFTLVELLSVIVVLGIIALIGYTSVGNIISSSRESSNKLTIKNYAKAVDQTIFLSEMNNKTVEYTSNWLQENVKFEKSKVVCDNFTYNKSTSLYGCHVNDSAEEYCYANNSTRKCRKTKNLIAYKNLYSDTNKFTIDDAGVVSGRGWNFHQTHYYIPKEYIGETLTFSADIKKSGELTKVYIAASINNTIVQGVAVSSTDEFKKSTLTFTPTSENDYIYITYGDGDGTIYAKNIQLEVSSTSTSYEPYGYINIE